MKTQYKISLILLAFILLCTNAHAQKSALLWGTYFGGDTIGYSDGLAIDASGNIYITGETYSGSGLATNGAYQTKGDSINGDAFLAKFSSTGNLLWATYYGGNGTDGANYLHADKFGNIYMTGSTQSTSGIATTGAYQTSYRGGGPDGDAFLAKFSPSGDLLWATYYGGRNDDEGFGVATDTSDNVYLTGYTESNSDIATNGAYQTSGDSVSGDAFLIKFSSTGNLLWGTYYGGKNVWGSSLAIDTSCNIYLTGQTFSGYGIATSGAYQTSFAGDSINGNAFLAKFNSSGSLLWGTYYGGNGGDEGIRLAVDHFGSIYITGNTFSSNGIATTGAYRTSFSGGSVWGDAFLAKFSTLGSLLWGTYYGGNNDDGGNGVATDKTGNIYITGYTNSTSGIATLGAYQTSFGGGEFDIFLAKFSSLGNLLWGSYYGGIGTDNGGNIVCDKSGNAYIEGLSSSPSGIATSGAYQTYINYGGWFLAKFNIPTYYDDAGIVSVLSPAGSLCAISTPIKVQLKNYGLNTLKSVKINWKINSKPQTTYNWTGSLSIDSSRTINIGNYDFTTGIDTIVAWTSLPNGLADSFPWNDTASIIDTIKPLPDANFLITSIAGTTYRFSANSKGQSYNWTFGDGKTGIGDTITHSYKKDSTYSVSLKVENINNCFSSFDTSLSVLTGLKYVVASQVNLHIFPNPFSDVLNISYSMPIPSHVKISITDMEGSLIATLADEKQESGNHNLQFDPSKYNFSTGIYYLRLIIGDEVIVSKVIKIV